MSKNLIFLRHGSTTLNLENKWMGSLDKNLCSQGIEEIKFASQQLKLHSIEVIYSSPLKRAIESADIVRQGLSGNVEAIIIKELEERHYGDLEGVIKTKENTQSLEKNPTVESKDELEKRVKDFILKLDKNKHTLIVSHSGVYSALTSILPYQNNSIPPKLRNGEFIKLKFF